MPPVISIDVGTTNSCVAVFLDGKVEIVPNKEGQRVTPSIVSYTNKGFLVGESAKKLVSHSNFTNTIFCEFSIQFYLCTLYSIHLIPNFISASKKVIGKKYSELSHHDILELVGSGIEMGSLFDIFNYVVTKTKKKKLNKEFKSPTSVTADIIKRLKDDAETFLRTQVTEAVITVPLMFSTVREQEIKSAAEIAGLKVLKVLKEPFAAVEAYRLDAKPNYTRNIIVLHLGGETFEATILTFENGELNMKAAGNMNACLGGKYFDKKLLNHVIEHMKKHSINLPHNIGLENRLMQACENAKIALSSSDSAIVNCKLNSGLGSLKTSVTKLQFEKINAEIFTMISRIIERLLKDAKFLKSDIDDVVLSGGSMNIPKVLEIIEGFFVGKTIHKSVNPLEVTAFGAILSYSNPRPLANINSGVFGVTPFSLGVEFKGGSFFCMIPKNTSIPVKFTTDRFSSSRPDQKSLTIKVYEGDDEKVANNKFLGFLKMSTLADNLLGKVKVEVTFEINSEGVLTVSGGNGAAETQSKLVVSINQVDRKKFTPVEKTKEESNSDAR